jgi:hypothetical protein
VKSPASQSYTFLFKENRTLGGKFYMIPMNSIAGNQINKIMNAATTEKEFLILKAKWSEGVLSNVRNGISSK